MVITLSDTTSGSLLRNTNNIRNICILAHVDHGKTTLADSLIASNGIISPRLAGKLRYMDSRKDEQERGITMKSSCISLYHKREEEEYLINLIDSPGHVDFSLEVSTAVRLCDGALIVVDVVEGVCPQTRTALKHAWAEKLKAILVFNKIDRLILEIKMSPLDAYIQLMQILEQVNSLMGDLFRSEVIEKTDESKTKTEGNKFSDWSLGLEEADDSNLYFSPEEGNVIFASAVDGWGFTIQDFSRILSKKNGFSEKVLCKTLWGNYYLDSKSKQVKKGAQENVKKPLFVKLILENIWLLYDTIIVKKDKEKICHIIESLKIDLKPQHLRFNDSMLLLRTILGRWITLASAILNSVCQKLPSPNQLSEEKVDTLMFGNKKYLKPNSETIALRSAFLSCSYDNTSPVIVFVSKMFPVERKHLPENRVKPLTIEEINVRRDEARQRMANKEQKSDGNEKEQTEHETVEPINSEVFIAFARIYSGCLRTGSEIYVLGPKHDPQTILQKLKSGYEINTNATLKDLKPDEHITKTRIDRLYLLMGRELESLTEVVAGNVFGIGGLEEHVLKSATLSTEIMCPAFSELKLMATPILRVAVEPENPAHLGQLVHGLKLLNQADASVQVLVQETGEQVLVTTGEVHLQRCIEDLRERYAKVPLLVSEPIVPFRETIVQPPKVDMVNEAINKISKTSTKETLFMTHTPDGLSSIKIKAIPLPSAVITMLEQNVDLIKFLTKFAEETNNYTSVSTSCCTDSTLKFQDAETQKIASDFRGKLKEALSSNDSLLEVDTIWSFGPKYCGPNLLFNVIDRKEAKLSFWRKPKTDNIYTKFESSFINGFQLATFAGPLCEEPMMGVGFLIYDWQISEKVTTVGIHSPYGPLSGQLMSTVKEGCRKAFQMQPQRLVAAMYSCSILVNTEVLGRMYALLNKRHGRILHGDLASGSGGTFNVTAFLPVAESFRFASEVRKQTSGLANPQLVFSHWEVIDLDPFWRPSTEEEYLLYGEKADSENYARIYMNNVRKRKGLPTDEKVVEHAEKQRTLSKNK